MCCATIGVFLVSFMNDGGGQKQRERMQFKVEEAPPPLECQLRHLIGGSGPLSKAMVLDNAPSVFGMSKGGGSDVGI